MNTTRRDFIRSAAGALTLASIPTIMRAASGPESLSLGYSLYGMKSVPLAEAFSQCARIGYRNVEVCMFAGFPAEPQMLSKEKRGELRRQIEGLGLTISSVMAPFKLNGDAAAQAKNLETLKLASELGQDLYPTKPPAVQAQLADAKPAQWEELKDRMLGRLQEWGEALKVAGSTAVLGTHAGTVVNTPERLLWLYKKSARRELALYFNHIHYLLEGVPLEQSLPALIPYSKFVHLQDATGTADNRNYLLPGDPSGPTNFPRYFRDLKRYRYAGPVVVHISGKFSGAKDYDPFAVADKCYRWMSAALRDAEG